MKKFFGLAAIALCSTGILQAQITNVTPPTTPTVQDTVPAINQKLESQETLAGQTITDKKKKFANVDLSHRAADHFMIQFGGMGLNGATSDYALNGFSREFNISFMLDKPFKTNPHYSLGFGIGYSSSNLFFNDKYVDIKSTETVMPITANITGTTNSFKKFKLVLNYVEIPLELRYSSKIENPSKGFRMAIGLKGGMMLGAHTKGKNEVNSDGSSIYGKGFIEKQYSKRFFKTTRISATARAGYGLFSIFGTYQLSPLMNTEAGPVIHPYSIGLAIGIM